MIESHGQHSIALLSQGLYSGMYVMCLSLALISKAWQSLAPLRSASEPGPVAGANSQQKMYDSKKRIERIYENMRNVG